MRRYLVVLAGLGFIAASACGDSGGTDGGSTTTGGTTTGGTTGGSTSGGTTGGTGGLAAGASCTGNTQCTSGICGTKGGGRCCTAACPTNDATCSLNANCDMTGACYYPANSTSCAPDSCTSAQLTKSTCDNGDCKVGTPAACPNNLQCASATSCLTICNATTECVSGFYCETNSKRCLAQRTVGSCVVADACTSGICGTIGTGNCCNVVCAGTTDLACTATGCSATTGDCTYPSGKACGTQSCSGSTLTAGTCNPVGACNTGSAPCPNNLICDPSGNFCLNLCANTAECVSGFYCTSGRCLAQVATGPCTTNEACTTGICGIFGNGHCCTAVCDTSDPTCGAKDCDNFGACAFPNTRTACGAPASCTGTTQTNPTTCDGAGACQPQGTTDCTPFICGATACISSCKDATSCIAGGFCDIGAATCCASLASGDTLTVDSATGSDATSCCGVGSNEACATVGHAMALIDNAQAQNVTISATVNGGAGDWTGAETYPVKLGWGAELNAPGVYFLDPKGVKNAAIFDVTKYSASDTVGYASIVGSAKAPIGVGMDSTNSQQLADKSAIAVETGATLYLANANVNGSYDNFTCEEAVLVQAGATLVLGQDQSGGITGTVTIGNNLGQEATNGYLGILCNTDTKGSGCTITDAALGGTSSLVIEGQEAGDIDLEDFGSITLSSNPIFGVAPTAAGFGTCPSKQEGLQFNPRFSILVNGVASLTLSNATIQCSAGTGLLLQSSPNGNGNPTVIVDSTTIQNTDVALSASAGAAIVTNSTINFNYYGVLQTTDGLNDGSIDLSGGGNTVVCSSNQESSQTGSAPGISAYNTSNSSLNAANVAWDTSSPDYFDCNAALTSCTCNLGSCDVSPGSDGMDAVDDSTNQGGVATSGNVLSPISCN